MKLFTKNIYVALNKPSVFLSIGVLCGVLGFSTIAHGQNSAPVLSSIANVTIEENNDDGTVIATPSATDADDDPINFFLSVNPNSAAGFFSINTTTGEVTADALDYEELWQLTTNNPLQLTLTVTASDGAATDNESFSLFVTNVDDLPYTQGDASGNISLNGSTSIGQSFTTTDAGSIEEFQIDVVTAPSTGIATVQFWQDSDLNPTASFTGPGHSETNLLYEFQVEIPNSGIQTITLPVSLPVEANTVYSMEMFGTSMFLRYAFPATYSRGRILWSNNLFGCCDLHFVLTIGEGTGAGPQLFNPINGTNIDASNGTLRFEWDGDGDGIEGESASDVAARGQATEDDFSFSLSLQTPGFPELVFGGIQDEFYVASLSDLQGGMIYEWTITNEDTEAESDLLRFRTPDNLEQIIAQITGIHDPAFSAPMEAYPNPFVDQVEIKYSLKEMYDASVAIYDIRGAYVADLPQQPNSLGGLFTWDGRSSRGDQAEPGLYLYRLELRKDGQVARTINGQL
ncbi:MAG: cadherin domain-containing protein, partial [Bacteroidota bacterium]